MAVLIIIENLCENYWVLIIFFMYFCVDRPQFRGYKCYLCKWLITFGASMVIYFIGKGGDITWAHSFSA